MKIQIETNDCKSCPFMFTRIQNLPRGVSFGCKAKDGPTYIENPSDIDPKCPYRGGKVLESESSGQYYYRNDECVMDSAHDASCICWYNEGTGPFPDIHRIDPDTKFEWRDTER